MYQLAVDIIMLGNKYNTAADNSDYYDFCSGGLAVELGGSTLDFTQWPSLKLWPWLGLQVASCLFHVGSRLRAAVVPG